MTTACDSTTNDDWITHDGGQCPDAVIKAARDGMCILMKFRDNGTEPTYSPHLWRWVKASRFVEHGGQLDDIVAYRIIEPSQPPGQPQVMTMADQVAAKAKRVFELMESQSGTKAFGSVMGSDILITIERVNVTPRPKYWPDDWDWPPELSNLEAFKAVLEGIPCTPEDVAAEELRQQREGTFEMPESLRDASKVLERIKRCDHKVVQGLDAEAVCIKCNEDLGWYCPASREHVCEYTDIHECCVYCGQPEERQ